MEQKIFIDRKAKNITDRIHSTFVTYEEPNYIRTTGNFCTTSSKTYTVLRHALN